jgi:signal transduction histidine kinase
MGFGLLAPLAATAVLAMLVFILSMVIWAREVDIRARMREESLVRQGAISRIAEVERSVFPQTNWGEAVARLDNRFDPEWARSNLTAYLAQVGEFDAIFVIGPDGRPLYASREGQDAPLSAYDAYRGTDALLADIREGERRRGAIAPPAPGAPRRMLTRPIQASGFFIDHGEVHLATASLVQPDFGDVLPRGERAPIVLTIAPLDAAVLAPLRERFQLENLTASLQRPQVGPRMARVQFPTLRSGPAVDLTWRPHRPGTELLRAAILPVLLVIAAFAAVGALMVHRARRAAAQLIASNRAQSEFLANMSHEIRTPLNGVVAIAGVLEKTPLSDRQAELVRIIRGSGETLERLLSDVLDLSKIETGALAIETEPFNLAEALRSVAALCGPRAEEKGVALRVEIPPAAEAVVLGDVVRVKQVVTNLVSNAVKFTDQGHVILRATAGRAPDAWRIEVEDTGVGFDPAKKSRIFARFQQADGSVTRRFGGSGLGLSISRQLVDLMGGTLDCDSRPGAGSTFTAELPLPRAAQPAPGKTRSIRS